MKYNKSEESEIEIICEVIKEIKKIPIIESIFWVPYITMDINGRYCNINIVYNSNPSFIDGTTNEEYENTTITTQLEILECCCDQVNSKLLGSGITFVTMNERRFSPSEMNTIGMISKIELISGKIMFDRYGNIKKRQQIIINYGKIDKYPNVYDIENIDDVISQIK